MRLTKDNKSMVVWILLAITLCLIGYDAYLCANREENDTISEVITNSSKRYLLVPFLFGLLMGHFFWSQHLKEDKEPSC